MRRIVRLNSRCNAGPNIVESTHQHLSVANERIQSSVNECTVLIDWSTAANNTGFICSCGSSILDRDKKNMVKDLAAQSVRGIM